MSSLISVVYGEPYIRKRYLNTLMGNAKMRISEQVGILLFRTDPERLPQSPPHWPH